ncbi:MAG: SIMPL domain-containing protein [Candidatus Paceibacterota bacterium]
MEIGNMEKSRLMKVGYFLLVILSVYFLMKTIAEIKGFNFIGGGAPASNVVSFEGKGEVSSTPDMATVSFNIMDTEPLVKDAQTKVTAKEKAVLDFLEKSGIDKKDIKTENYSSHPKYDYGTPCYSSMGVPCRVVEPKITGYEVSEFITVKVRDIKKAGEIVQGLGQIGVSSMSGPNYSVENEDKLKEQARKIAIDDAKAKAKVLSKDLGVRLVRIVNFSENGNYPIMYESRNMAKDGMAVAPASPAPELPVGENKIISNVTITYEIR